ncbi:MAG: hypothetical protein U1F42_00110 [Candidatus Competibacteraceae bacterium]
MAEAKALLAEESPVDGGLTGMALVDWVEIKLVYKLPRLSREEIRRMLDIFNVELKQTRFYQEVFAEGLGVKVTRKVNGKNASASLGACWM